MKKIVIFDTTLRDGEQSPGASLNFKQKIEIAQALSDLNVDVIEAGFPIASPGDFESVKEIAKIIKGPSICGLARAKKEDIDRCYDAVKYSDRPRIHTFLATSDIHMKYKLKKNRQEVLNEAVWAVKYACSKIKDVEFSAEDAARSDFEFLKKVVKATIDAGAKTINIPDTVGYATPYEFGQMIKNLITDLKIGSDVIISVHCHNDLGLATANSIAAIINGAGQIECTINGLGERAGNASLEEVVMILKTREKYLHFTTGLKHKNITRVSKLVSKLTGIIIQPNKAIVGANAFAHEAGIHQHGVMAKALTYEIMTPESVGLSENKIVLGKHSGRHAFAAKLKTLGYKSLKDEETNDLFNQFKLLSDKKKDIYDEDILSLVEEKFQSMDISNIFFKLSNFHVISGNGIEPTATVVLTKTENLKQIILKEASCGDGPIDALFKATDKLTNFSGKLLDFSLKSVSSGKDAIGEAVLKIQLPDNNVITTHGTSTDILESALKAYISAINRYLFIKTK